MQSVRQRSVAGKEWAAAIARRYEAGETVPRISVQYAEEVLGRQLLRGGKHAQRPDTKDRQAGDYRDDKEMVVL